MSILIPLKRKYRIGGQPKNQKQMKAGNGKHTRNANKVSWKANTGMGKK